VPSVVADLRRGRGAQLLTRLSAVLCAPKRLHFDCLLAGPAGD